LIRPDEPGVATRGETGRFGLVLVACQATETRDAYAKALTAAGLRVITTGDSVGALVKAVALRPRALVIDVAYRAAAALRSRGGSRESTRAKSRYT
jgi:hypothetical protein